MLSFTYLCCFFPLVLSIPTGTDPSTASNTAAYSSGPSSTAGSSSGGLPTIDLGYEVHRAISFNQTGQNYNFTNIRFAQSPVGDLRFAAPVAPTGRNAAVQDGSTPRICPQANPAWEFIAALFLQSLLNGTSDQFDYQAAQQQLQAYIASGAASGAPAPGTTEDCLFLDVHVPKAIFDGGKSRKKAPVLVWIYGGGYTAGQKGGTYNPSGLIKASQKDGSPGIVYVALNYRLGALGWLAGSTVQGEGGVSNAGLYDQRLALEWVQKNIHLFGGDPNQVTVMGESAGGGSIEFQMTAYGGQKKVPFQRVIPQSPGFVPIASQYVQENATQNFLSLLNVTTIAEARKLDSRTVIAANSRQVGLASYGQFIYGPVADGVFAPSLPGLLFNAGAFAKNISVLVGHNTNEAPLFSPPFVQTNDQLRSYVLSTYPSIPTPSLNYLLNTLYPPTYDGTQPYNSLRQRLFLLIQESAFTCNTNYINRAYNNHTYAYEFQVPPAFHGFDVQYTFYNGQGTSLTNGLYAPIAQLQQAYITNFVKYGNPNGVGVPNFPMQGMNASMNGINFTGVRTERDPTVNARCAWWQKALFY